MTPSNGMYKGLIQVDFRTQEQIEAEQRKQQTVQQSLGQALRQTFDTWARERIPIEDEWARDFRAFMAVYDPHIKLHPKRSQVYVRLTATKVMAAYAQLVDVFSGAFWDIEPTEIPSSGLPIDDLMQMIMASAAVRDLKKRMQDQLTEAGFDELLKTFLMELCILGSAAFCGVETTVEHNERWQLMPNGQFDLVRVEAVVPDIRAVSVWNLYPDPFADCVDDLSGIFERSLPNRQQFEALASSPGFDQEQIRLILTESPNGNYVEQPYESERRAVLKKNETNNTTGRYDVLRYWGCVTGEDLLSCGCDDQNIEREKSYHANIWVCGSRTIKAMINPYKPTRIPYHITPYVRIPGSIWGMGPPRMMRDSQQGINSSTRAMLDNMAHTAGPQMEIDMRSIDPTEDPDDIFPFKLWKRNGGDTSAPLLRVHRLDNNVQPALAIIDNFRRFTDEETMLPAFTHGEQQNFINKTATGLSILKGASNALMQTIVKNIDDFGIEPLIRALYHWNMQFGDDVTIKADAKVNALGLSLVMTREVKSQRLLQFLQLTANPLDADKVDRKYLLTEAAEAMDIDSERAIPNDTSQGASVLGGGNPAGPVSEAGQNIGSAIGGATQPIGNAL